MNKKTLVSGITSTGKLTLGNYIGAIRNFVKLQDEFNMFIFVADLHSLTNEIVPSVLRKNIKEIAALYLACGLDPEKTVLFKQSDVYEHGLMQWILLNQTTIGELSRMTQFKDKSSKITHANNTESIPSGLLTYPTLMAADILLYNPNLVPVGQDQVQHLELTRKIARKLNNKYNTKFNEPTTFVPETGAKIMSLTNPTKKMSKSSDDINGTIFLLEDPELAYKKIKKSITDSENKVYHDPSKPGVSNLLEIYACLENKSLKEAQEIFKDKNYLELKEGVGNSVKNFLTKLQAKYQENYKRVDEILNQGKIKAQKVASYNLNNLMKKIGIRDK
ncbi:TRYPTOPHANYL-TRNA SYNTHETASE (TRYPTOPHAN--TRNA LIGASE) (TRPRS) [Mycoplasmopsis pulmonis]|uniref:Tryptophan--tRNA ligase n=1 Tax=Mycoplasmopsis pulmonis (strain UAB CTIP) TaxID=272635 RepID=SYW_MYCPU|nr:tryptophan--tRNA ligase [Mycoplasmopsis pulmonis]Q98PH7.1 RecName: Full=Tryptophan--tRNA ligase; AltName: Full=Tryptophanyl-tRNA synthetase; Short=TrpRS [Mycoplasmopsis pulmonis UAB CTIP]MDZ7293405.1 tryptophan--tRNA ligase [Mycoplasmopsis pulmonis]CAC13918.1 TRYPTOPHANYL-TRNA SYNTHETASE (TRYPTOPHAN--TRNA LIGASE) (TRPRS) [Mycoplasmopsis pulmonis]VEU68513.1 tryptophan--tRNA ligase [Mycoplasmopsis pulmonis]